MLGPPTQEGLQSVGRVVRRRPLMAMTVLMRMPIVSSIRRADRALQLPVSVHLRPIVTVAVLFRRRRAVYEVARVGRGFGRVLRS